MPPENAKRAGSREQFSAFPSYLQRVFPEGCSLRALLRQLLAALPYGQLVAKGLITDADPPEYSEGLLTHTFVHLSPHKPPPKPHLSFQQRSAQSEVSVVQVNSIRSTGYTRNIRSSHAARSSRHRSVDLLASWDKRHVLRLSKGRTALI